MLKITGIIILVLCFVPFNAALALHDDESIGKGGAWESDEGKRNQRTSPEKEKSIDMEFDKAFKKSPIIIPSLEQKSDEWESISTEQEDSTAPFPYRD